MIFPDGWDAETIRDMCGAKTGKYSLGDCSVRWAYILAIIGILNALILSFLAFVLGNRQTDLLQEELKQENKGECAWGRGWGPEVSQSTQTKPELERVQAVKAI
uniref:LHFPL tetraspan subfamily member 4 n=1 Tax=Panthera leo TaxID=9689 RepID=A0A8C8XSR9_PANLE